MSEQKSEEWLPPGWTVELKVRKNGKKDKCYIAPSRGLKFNSKAEVSRYLKDVQINHTKSKQKKKGSHKRKRSASKCIVEKVEAEGLPPGWIKEIRVKKKARTIRRDPYYIDPVSGYVFRSMKDVLRYLETGDLGRLAMKPKDRGSSDVELDDVKVSSPAVTEEQKLTSCETKGQIITGQRLNLNKIVNDEKTLNSTSTGECMLLSQNTSDQSGEGTDLNILNLPEPKDSEQIGAKSDFSRTDSTLAPAVRTLQENKLTENGVVTGGNRKTQLGLRKSRERKEPKVPRRSSKRLAGLEVDPTPELKTRNQARRIAARQSGKAEASTAESSAFGSGAQKFDQLEAAQEVKCTSYTSRTTEVLVSNNSEIPSADLGTLEDSGEKVETENKAAQEVKCTSYTSRTTEVLVSNNSEIPSADLGTLEDSGEKVETENKVDEKQGCPLVVPPGNPPIPQEHAEKVETENKADVKPGSAVVLPFGESWPDPCIEFAVKTLTGAIPVGGDLDIQDYFHQLGSSTQVDTDLKSPNVGSDNLFQTDLLCQQFDREQKDLVEHTLPQTGDVSFQNSGKIGLHQHGEEK
ncbi:hypothetical protein L1049_021318 [Liquidambar formosana]|uniref:MBD domain-containing protein n=1 Tax=Liquidambar formosana TaxID=63359 RepID=A0AAP0SEC7_LIQFO